MVMSFDQAIAAAIRHLDSAMSMREEKLEEEEEGGHLEGGGEGSAKETTTRAQQEEEADQQLAFVVSIIVESVVDSAIKPKGWLEEEIQSHQQEGGRRSPFGGLRSSPQYGGVSSTKQRP